MKGLLQYTGFLAFILLGNSFLHAQPFVDPCFTSGNVGTTFAANANISNNNSDLLNWTGSNWTGGWPGANITLAPPGVAGTRAIWSGDGSVWTTGGEGFGLRMSTPIVTGTTYTFAFRRVSHGTGQNGNFAPVLYTNTSGTFGTSYGAIPGVGTAWSNSNISFTATAGSNGHTFVYFHNSSGSGMFMGCTTTILAMSFSNLQALQTGEQIQVEWHIQNEESYLWHVIERSSDGNSFTEIGRVPSRQVGDQGFDYQYPDLIKDVQHNGQLYYRIKSIDLEGKEAMSPVVMTKLGEANAFQTLLYPNPAAQNSTLEVAFYADEAGDAQYQIVDLSGRVLQQGIWHIQAQRNLQSLDLQGLTAGLYLLDIQTATARNRSRLRID